MTKEEKAKAYDEALERAKNLYNSDETSADIEIACERIFPELKESEDERIRKELIDFVKSRLAGFPECGRFIAWLEKQSKYSILNVPSREVILAIWDLGNEWKELTNGCISTEYGTQLEYIQKHWEESEYYLREKKVEPKFKVGDKIVHKVNKESPFIITEITNDCYKGGTQYEVLIEQQNNFELVPYKFDINSLVPFESKVLVRDNDYDEWISAFWGHLRQKAYMKYDTLRGVYRQCIPYEGNEHLLGKTNDCDNFYKTWE